MAKVLVVHWKEAEWEERAERIRRLGHEAIPFCEANPGSLRSVRETLPDAIVIDLDRLPSHGREMAVALRQSKATRLIPLVLLNGDAEKVAKIKAQIPDARYGSWGRVESILESALQEKPREAVVPKALSGYEPASLPKKLGVRSGVSVRVLNAPPDFAASIAPAEFTAKASAGLVICFVRSRAELIKRFEPAARAVAMGGSLWIAWPKKTSALAADLGQNDVREFGLARQWVDFKICSIDETWSGVRFARRAS